MHLSFRVRSRCAIVLCSMMGATAWPAGAAATAPSVQEEEGTSAHAAAGSTHSAGRHDGFYARIGAGAAGAYTKEPYCGPNGKCERSFAGPALQLLVGGTATEGLVLGGGLVGQTVGSIWNSPWPLAVVGPCLDWFPDVHRGFHAGTMLGVGSVPFSRSTALAGALWAGYDLWVADQWSMGIAAQGIVGANRSQFGAGYQLVLSGTYH